MAATLVPNHRPAPRRALEEGEVSRRREAVAVAITALLVALGSIGIVVALQRSASVVGHAPGPAPIERELSAEAAAR